MKCKWMVVIAVLLLTPMFLMEGARADTYVMSMSLGGTTGGYYTTFTPIANYINAHTKLIRIIPTTSGGSVENAANLVSKVAQIAPIHPEAALSAFLNKSKDIQFVGPGMVLDITMFVVLKKSGITDINQLVGKNVALGARGSAARNWAILFLEELGIKDKVNEKPYGWEEATTALINGEIGAFAVLGSVVGVNPRVQSVAVTHPVNLIDLSKGLEQTNFFKKYPWFRKGDVKAGTYNGLDTDVVSFGQAAQLFTNKDVPDEAVYEFMKFVYSPEAQQPGSKIDYKSADPLSGMLIPMHSGAKKYWEDRGFTIPKPLHE